MPPLWQNHKSSSAVFSAKNSDLDAGVASIGLACCDTIESSSKQFWLIFNDYIYFWIQCGIFKNVKDMLVKSGQSIFHFPLSFFFWGFSCCFSIYSIQSKAYKVGYWELSALHCRTLELSLSLSLSSHASLPTSILSLLLFLRCLFC